MVFILKRKITLKKPYHYLFFDITFGLLLDFSAWVLYKLDLKAFFLVPFYTVNNFIFLTLLFIYPITNIKLKNIIKGTMLLSSIAVPIIFGYKGYSEWPIAGAVFQSFLIIGLATISTYFYSINLKNTTKTLFKITVSFLFGFLFSVLITAFFSYFDDTSTTLVYIIYSLRNLIWTSIFLYISVLIYRLPTLHQSPFQSLHNGLRS